MDIRSYCQTDLAQLPWLPLDQREALPNVPAVYFALGEASRVLYIGKSVSLNGRWRAHHRLTELQRLGNVRLAWIELEAEELLEEVEQALIGHFGPALNGREVPWDRLKPVMLRVHPEILERIDKAAKRLGLTRTGFVVSSAIKAVEKLERMDG